MLPAPANPAPGLCGTCRHARRILSDRGVRFVRCGRSDTDPRYARYPMLPVTVCQGHELETAAPRPGPAAGGGAGSAGGRDER